MGTSLAQRVSFNLREILHERRMSQSALARDVGVTPATVSRWLLETDRIGLDRIDAILAALDISLDELTAELPRGQVAGNTAQHPVSPAPDHVDGEPGTQRATGPTRSPNNRSRPRKATAS